MLLREVIQATICKKIISVFRTSRVLTRPHSPVAPFASTHPAHPASLNAQHSEEKNHQGLNISISL